MKNFLQKCNVDTLKKIASKMNINISELKKKSDLVNVVDKAFNVNNNMLGEGKDAKIYDSNKNNGVAVKQYKKLKSPVRITSEIDFQKQASERGISPKILNYNLSDKTVEMEKLDRTLLDVLKSSGGKISIKYQRRIIEIFRILDELKIFHADPNILNFMEKNGNLYIIDFGFAKKINKNLIKKHDNHSDLNMQFMPLGLYIKLKELSPNGNFDIIKEAIPSNKKYIVE